MSAETSRRTVTTASGASIDVPVVIGGAEYLADPQAHHAWLRDEAPVHAGRLVAGASQPVWLVSRYEDCRALLTDRRFLRAPGGVSAAATEMPEHLRLITMDSLIYRDDPEHRRLRALVVRPFTPRAVGLLGHRTREIAEGLLDALSETSAGSGPVDLRAHFALPLPSSIIAVMVGVDRADRGRFLDRMRAVFAGLTGPAPEGWDDEVRAVVDLVRELVARRRADPGDDILSGLVHAEVDGDRLSGDELVAMVFTLLVAGYETTHSLITNAVVALLDHPRTLARLRDAPEDAALWRAAVEELVRWTGTVGGTELITAAADVTWHDVTIPAGALVLPLLGAANRDPRAFADPERFDVDRTEAHHVGFGHGVHFCLGANLARMETRVALQVLLRRCPDLRLAVDRADLEPDPVPLISRWREVPVVLD